uniref:Coenzyme Q-binding protein COQ10 START domain-containing protein n=1 Tax=Hanusia phi TaxID=3032 RepID=A0A7S0H7N8_9CRYP|mmetsp:Transcript_13934/g.32108  ORF Transcript_13934/g.32108 Transcript_13934/m.32108 type:complete len:329 (+) Transcript_13934:122-1108(+)
MKHLHAAIVLNLFSCGFSFHHAPLFQSRIGLPKPSYDPLQRKSQFLGGSPTSTSVLSTNHLVVTRKSSYGNKWVCALTRPKVDLQGDWGKIFPAAERPRRPPLPRLTDAEVSRLLAGDRVEKQTRSGLLGEGLVVVDVKADVSTVMAVLSDVERYPQRIATVREALIIPGTRSSVRCKARFKLSRFRLEVTADLSLNKFRNMLEFQLDRSGMGSSAFDEARGFWFLEQCPEREEGWTRVWLSAKVRCSPLLPPFIVDYAASRALPRATSWLRPVIEPIAAGLDKTASNVHSAELYLARNRVSESENYLAHVNDAKPPSWSPSDPKKSD